MEPEYKIIKCPTCGHDKRGPRIVKLSKTDFLEYKRLEIIRNRLPWLMPLALFTIAISAILISVIGLNPFTGFGLVLWATCMVISFCGVAAYDYEKRGKLDRAKAQILNNYGVDESEWIEVISLD